MHLKRRRVTPNIYSHVKDQGKLNELHSSPLDNMAELNSKILSITPSFKIWPSPHEKAVPFICALSKAYSLALHDKKDSSSLQNIQSWIFVLDLVIFFTASIFQHRQNLTLIKALLFAPDLCVNCMGGICQYIITEVYERHKRQKKELSNPLKSFWRKWFLGSCHAI